MCVGKPQGPVKIPKNDTIPNSFYDKQTHNISQTHSLHIKRIGPYFQKVCDGVFVSQVSGLSLVDYVTRQSVLCNTMHTQPCTYCPPLLKVANIIVREGTCLLSRGFSITSPGIKYDTEKARRKSLVMPLVTIRMGDPNSGAASTLLIELIPGVNYQNIHNILNTMESPCSAKRLDKTTVQDLLSLATSDRERECIRYTLYKASGITQTQARCVYGFENMNARAIEVENCLIEAQKIRKAIDNLACIQDKAFLSTLGVLSDTDGSDDLASSSEDEDDNAVGLSCVRGIESDAHESDTLHSIDDELCIGNVKSVLEASKYNWFDLCERLEHILGDTNLKDQLPSYLDRLVSDPSVLEVGEKEWELLMQSKLAFDAVSKELVCEERDARATNGEIVTGTESEVTEAYFDLSDPLSKEGKQVIIKRRTAIKRRARRLKAKRLAEKRLLSRKPSKHTSKVLSDCPDIGQMIEDFVSAANVGADQWRRTGVLTFDGNRKLPNKVTYQRIQQHLKTVYGRNFAYGTVVQLCIARNRRRRSASRYRGVAKVTTRRARKGFTLRYNPDSHWSNSFYKGLNMLQYKDGQDLLNINRDDASGFRLDTLTTNKQYANPVVKGQDILTTRTDYVNKYPSVLQTTSYNFSSTDTTIEDCVGVVNASGTYPKNPAQHACDLEMLDSKEELKHVFKNMEMESPKQIECIRVDGATDEGPGHEEVQYWWTLRHIEKKKLATLVTTRSSGSSYLNRVELQNGCLSRSHSNLFIPSTLGGSCIDPLTGGVNKELLHKNHQPTLAE